MFEMARDTNEKAETRASARGLCEKIQQIQFVFLLKLYCKIFEYCTPVIKVMEKPTLDAVQESSMVNDLKLVLQSLNFEQI